MANIASQYERCNDVIDALVDWEKSFVDETPHLLLASCALKAKELVKAQSHLMAGMKLNAKCFYCALWLGDLNFEAMDWPNSIKYYAIAAPLKPQDYRPFNQLGKALSNSGKHIEASRAFAKANERKPKDADIVYMWAMSLVRASDKGEAWKVWGQLDELDKKRAAEVRALLTQ
jgi:tetratricopeptide (TPR) repeat protein